MASGPMSGPSDFPSLEKTQAGWKPSSFLTCLNRFPMGIARNESGNLLNLGNRVWFPSVLNPQNGGKHSQIEDPIS